jgi:hypothetical protein
VGKELGKRKVRIQTDTPVGNRGQSVIMVGKNSFRAQSPWCLIEEHYQKGKIGP